MKKEISVITPYFNEEEVILETIDELDNVLSNNFDNYEIVLVNDGSFDNSQNIVESAVESKKNLTSISNSENKGIWKSWENGCRNAKYDCVAVIDSDLQYQPTDIINLYDKHIEGFQFVQGVRDFSAEVSYLRNLISKSLSLLLKLLFFKQLKGMVDVKSGFFVTRKSLLINIFDFFPSYKYGQTFISIYANFLNSFTHQIPILFTQRVSGKSYLRSFPIVTIYYVLKEICLLKLFLFNKDFYILALEYFTKNYKNLTKFSFYEKIKLNVFFKLHFFHKWTIGKNLKRYVEVQLKFQNLSSDEINLYQNRRLQDLIWYFYQNSEFFSAKMRSVCVHPYEINTIKDLQKIPPLTKDELKLNFSKGLLSSKKSYFKNLLISTSGSTGTPLSLYANSEQLKVRWSNTFRAWTWTGWTPNKRQARLWHQTIGMSNSQIIREFVDNIFFKRIFIPAYKISEKNISNFINKLNKHDPFLVDGYAESFNFLVNYIKNNNIDTLNIDAIISSAQEMPDKLKVFIENEIGAKVFDKYGAREFSGIAYESKNNTGHLISDDSYLVEILKNSHPVKDGDTGELFITDLNNYVTPMIRYQIGDLGVKPIEDSTKDNIIQFKTLGEIQGRTKAIIICDNNTWVPGTFFAHFFKEYAETIISYQVVQNTLEEIDLKLVINSNSNISIDSIISELRKTVGNIKINIIYVENIEMIRTGKIMGAISNVDTSKIMNNNFENTP